MMKVLRGPVEEHPYNEQLQVAQDYSTLNKAIGIHILNFTSIPDVQKYHNVFHIIEKDSGVLYFKDLELHTIGA